MVVVPVERTDKRGAAIKLPVPTCATLVDNKVLGKRCVVVTEEIAGGRCCTPPNVSTTGLLLP